MSTEGILDSNTFKTKYGICEINDNGIFLHGVLTRSRPEHYLRLSLFVLIAIYFGYRAYLNYESNRIGLLIMYVVFAVFNLLVIVAWKYRNNDKSILWKEITSIGFRPGISAISRPYIIVKYKVESKNKIRLIILTKVMEGGDRELNSAKSLIGDYYPLPPAER